MDERALTTRLANVRWIGGGSGAGKSTVAERLAEAHGLRLYHAEQFSSYIERSDPATAPLAHAFAAMDMDERWVTRSPEVMLRTFHGFQGEGFPLVLEDMLALPAGEPVIAEGFNLLPRQVAPLLTGGRRAVWLLPTPEFRKAAFEERGSTWTIPNRTSDPGRALANLLERDAMFTEEVRREAAALGLRTIDMNGCRSLDETVRAVADALELPPP
jgi:2-phosphoglycerate kinase